MDNEFNPVFNGIDPREDEFDDSKVNFEKSYDDWKNSGAYLLMNVNDQFLKIDKFKKTINKINDIATKL